MSTFRLTPLAIDDLDQIAEYLTERSGPDLARRIRFEIFTKIEMLAAYPALGHRRAELTRRPFLFFPSDPYLIVYDRRESFIAVLAVLHGARDVRHILRQRS